MKRILYLLVLVFILVSCRSSKNYLERSDEHKALQDAVKKLNKEPGDEKALEAVPILYKNIQASQLAKIKSLSGSTDPGRWDKIINSYEALQASYSAIINSTPAFKLVTPVNYSTELLESRQAAAQEYYNLGLAALDKEGRDNAKKSYNYFKKAKKYVPGFKDVDQKIRESYENAVVDVLINPVQDNSFFFNSGWGNAGYNYSNEYFQQTLVRDLQNTGNNRYAARFYTEWQARRDNVQPDWVIDLRLRDMDIPYPTSYNYSRNVSSRVQVGTDTAGRPLYQTVYATLHLTRMSFNARANMEVSIQDVNTRKNISFRSFRDNVRWEDERGTYTGDSRALSAYDWQVINNSNRYDNNYRREDILGELYRKIYPQVLNHIQYAVDW